MDTNLNYNFFYIIIKLFKRLQFFMINCNYSSMQKIMY